MLEDNTIVIQVMYTHKQQLKVEKEKVKKTIKKKLQTKIMDIF